MSSEIKYHLQRFNIDTLKKDRIVFLIGRRGSGKTTGVKYVLKRHSDIDMGIIICGTIESSKQYKDIFPDSFIFSPYNQKDLENAIRIQKVRLHEYETGIRKKVPYMVILTDDCLFGKPFKGKFIRNIFQNGRHWKLLFINTCQYAVDITTDLRGQIDYLFLYKVNSPQEREKLFNIFGGMFPDKKTFCKIHEQCTKDYGCMVIDNTQPDPSLEKSVFWFRPPMLNNIRIGSRSMWKYHEKYYNQKKATMSAIYGEDDLGTDEKATKKNSKSSKPQELSIRVIQEDSRQ